MLKTRKRGVGDKCNKLDGESLKNEEDKTRRTK